MGNDNDQATVENVPLFLVIEETKKTMKLAYVDTPDHASDEIFNNAGLRIKRLNEEATDDSRYIFAGCRINRHEIEKFRNCMEEFEKKMLSNGFTDYRMWSLAALIELIEGQADDAEYPKSMVIPFIHRDSEDEALLACYSLTETSAYNPEVIVFNSNPSINKDGYINEADAFALVLRKDTQVSYDLFRKTYLKHRNGISCIASLDVQGKLHFDVALLPEETCRQNGIPLVLAVTVYEKGTEAKLTEFFREWDECYQKIHDAVLTSQKVRNKIL